MPLSRNWFACRLVRLCPHPYPLIGEADLIQVLTGKQTLKPVISIYAYLVILLAVDVAISVSSFAVLYINAFSIPEKLLKISLKI
jgi:hypothetical protein